MTQERPPEELATAEIVEERSDDEEAQSPDYLDDLRRVQAEFDNYRKRVSRDQAALIARSTAALVEQLLPVLDDFDLALLASGQTQDFAKMVKGVELVYAKLRETLERVGLEKIEATGKPFDPSQHEAVMQAGGEGDQQVVVEEFRPGYRYAGTVLRPSMVKVGRQEG